MNPIVYDVSRLVGLAAITAGVDQLAGIGWAAVAFGAVLIVLTEIGVRR